jgi:hypothetical protein
MILFKKHKNKIRDKFILIKKHSFQQQQKIVDKH